MDLAKFWISKMVYWSHRICLKVFMTHLGDFLTLAVSDILSYAVEKKVWFGFFFTEKISNQILKKSLPVLKRPTKRNNGPNKAHDVIYDTLWSFVNSFYGNWSNNNEQNLQHSRYNSQPRRTNDIKHLLTNSCVLGSILPFARPF